MQAVILTVLLVSYFAGLVSWLFAAQDVYEAIEEKTPRTLILLILIALSWPIQHVIGLFEDARNEE